MFDLDPAPLLNNRPATPKDISASVSFTRSRSASAVLYSSSVVSPSFTRNKLAHLICKPRRRNRRYPGGVAIVALTSVTSSIGTPEYMTPSRPALVGIGYG